MASMITYSSLTKLFARPVASAFRRDGTRSNPCRETGFEACSGNDKSFHVALDSEPVEIDLYFLAVPSKLEPASCELR